jgi:VanZ family protein
LITISEEISNSIAIDVDYKDKYVHFLFYLIFVLLWFLFLVKTKFANSVNKLVFFAAIVYGITIEIFQGAFTNTRIPDVYDVLANSGGALTGIVIINFLFRNTKTTP